MTQHSPWQFDDRVAHLAWGNDRAQVDLRSPSRGVQLALAGSREAALEMLGVELGEANPELSDVFVRGGDLVATYAQTAERPARVQIYWRHMASDAERLTLDLIVSVQTSLLDSWPSLQTRSWLAARAVLPVSASPDGDRFAPGKRVEFERTADQATGCLGFELNTAPLGYIEMIHPSDFWRGSLAPANDDQSRTVCSWELFPQQLEKGVILRARLRGVVLRKAPTSATLDELYSAFLAEKLPLTV